MAKINGTSGDVTFKGVPLCVTNWSGEDSADILDTSNKCSGGFRDNITGLRQFTFDFEAYYDEATHVDDPPNLKSGEAGAFDLDIDGTNSISGNCRLASVSYDSAVDGVVTISGSAQSYGEFYVAGESTS